MLKSCTVGSCRRLCHWTEDQFFGQSMTLRSLACCSIGDQKLADRLVAAAGKLVGSVGLVKVVAASILLQFYS